MSKHVCIVRQECFPAEAHLKKNVDALTDAGFRVDIVCLREVGAGAREEYRGGTIYRLPLTHRRGGTLRYLFEYGAFFLMAALFLAYRSVRQRYDIVEVYNMPDFLVFAALPAKLLGSKIVLYLFELMPEHSQEAFTRTPDHPLIRLMRWLERRSVRFAHRVIVVSSFQDELVTARSSPRVRPTVILNVPDEELFDGKAAADSVEPSETFRVITHGSILRRYGIESLIRAVPYLRQEVPNLHVEILGQGEYRETLEQLAADLGVRDEVSFLDSVPIEDVPAIIGGADVGIVTIPLPWLLPNKLFEYVAMATPVVASASPSLTGIFDSEAIAYFWPDDERDLARRIVEIYEDPERACLMAAQAKKQFERCGWETMKRRYIAVHDGLLPAGSGAGISHSTKGSAV